MSDERRLEDILAEHRDEPDDPADETDRTADPLDPFAGLEPARDPEAEDEDALPDAPLFALLRTVQDDVGIERIDRIWVFPPRRLEAGETALVVVAAFHSDDPDRRRVYAAHYTAIDDVEATRIALQEHGTAPVDRVGRLVEEVVDRLGDDPAAAPRAHDIAGQDQRWHAVLHELALTYLEETRRSPRLR